MSGREHLQGDCHIADGLTSVRGGLMWIMHPPGAMLRKGDLAVDMMDVWGDNVEKVEMSCDGYCWFLPSAEETRR